MVYDEHCGIVQHHLKREGIPGPEMETKWEKIDRNGWIEVFIVRHFSILSDSSIFCFIFCAVIHVVIHHGIPEGVCLNLVIPKNFGICIGVCL